MATLHALKNRLTASQLNSSAPVDSADLCHDDKNTKTRLKKIDVKQFFLFSKNYITILTFAVARVLVFGRFLL